MSASEPSGLLVWRNKKKRRVFMTDEERRRRIRRQRQRARRRKQIRRRVTLLVLLLLLVTVGAVAFFLNRKNPIKSHVTIEAGNEVPLLAFLEDPQTDARFLTDIAQIDTAKPGDYEISIGVGKSEYTATLTVADTTPPTGDAVSVTIFSGDALSAADCVENISDVTQVSAAFEKEPDLTTGGEVSAVVVLTDAAGNKTKLPVTITVLTDTEAPVIEGAEDIDAFVGDSISYKSGITVTDDYDADPKLEIDNSRVDLTSAGVYDVIYTATDEAGNSSSVTITLTLTDKPDGYVDPEEVYALAQDVYDEIIDDSMSDMQKAFAIYVWVRTNIGYTGDSDKSSWTRGAYDAFTNRSGDCYNYFAAAKALFNMAGIENIDVVKSDTSHSSHFWSLINLGDGWYHVDCTPRKGDGDNFFMVTDEELEAYSVQHNNSHIFDSDLYPERATVSLQDKVDYNNSKLID
jgi:hypothetical protein